MIRKLLVLTGIKIILLSLFIKSEAKLRMIYNNGHDALFVARCEAKCWKVENRGCIKGCLSKPSKKPGTCPQNITTLSPFARVCLRSCQVDSQCSGLEKCCQHNCGITCQEPENLLSAVGLPNMPKDIRVHERKRRTIHIEWSAVPSQATTVFLVEEHHHTGKHFAESKLTKWLPLFRTNKTSCVLKRIIKPGNWYQFRVAAVNENGTIGYSDNSLPFSISISPKPPRAPVNVTVGPVFKTRNDSINVELRWIEPLSDLAIQRYKVFWSIRLHGIKALDSVLVRHQVVPKIHASEVQDRTSFLLQNLTSNSLYFLQVQAISQYGNQRLKSEKSNLVINTSNYINASDYDFSEQSLSVTARIEDLRLQKLFWFKTDLKARITWKPRKSTSKYTVTWWQSGYCDFKGSSDNNSHSKLSGITDIPQFELQNIKFNCRYTVTVREVSPEEKKPHQDPSITFETPSCKKFRSSHKQIKCME